LFQLLQKQVTQIKEQGEFDMCEDKCQCNGCCDCHCGEDGHDCCCDQQHFQRRYQTKAEQIADLETYLADLKKEVQAVEERLADLKK